MFEDVDDILEHFGVKGMHWGERHDGPHGVSGKTNREAKKDAKEHARAKMFYGEGAGNRRKLIKATVEAKSKRDPAYKKAFDHHIQNQDMSTHASKARTERKRTDRKKGAKQTGGAIARQLTGEMGTKAAIVALVAGGAAYAKSPRAQAFMTRNFNRVKNEFNRRGNARRIADFINK
jgi:hypothetical protein